MHIYKLFIKYKNEMELKNQNYNYYTVNYSHLLYFIKYLFHFVIHDISSTNYDATLNVTLKWIQSTKNNLLFHILYTRKKDIIVYLF